MYRRNLCIEEMTESLQRGLREAVRANSSPAHRAEARERAEHAEWLLRAALALAAALSGLAAALSFWG